MRAIFLSDVHLRSERDPGYERVIRFLEELAGDKGLNACGNCGACSAVCPFGINISTRINSLMAMNLTGGEKISVPV